MPGLVDPAPLWCVSFVIECSEFLKSKNNLPEQRPDSQLSNSSNGKHNTSTNVPKNPSQMPAKTENRATNIGIQSLFKIWPLIGYTHTPQTTRSVQNFIDPKDSPKVIFTDNSLEFGKACEDLQWNH